MVDLSLGSLRAQPFFLNLDAQAFNPADVVKLQAAADTLTNLVDAAIEVLGVSQAMSSSNEFGAVLQLIRVSLRYLSHLMFCMEDVNTRTPATPLEEALQQLIHLKESYSDLHVAAFRNIESI